jgi:hypothetical protein
MNEDFDEVMDWWEFDPHYELTLLDEAGLLEGEKDGYEDT